MRISLALLLALTACKRPPASPRETPTGAHDAQIAARPPSAPVDAAPSVATPPPADAAPAAVLPSTPGASRYVRVYVAGESIETWNRFVRAPFTDAGLAANPADNSDDEYGWMVPFADRLHRRAPDLTVVWVGTGTWHDYDDKPYSGRYPSASAAPTSSIPGTTIDAWLEQRRGELEHKTHCYDVAIASRGGNDFGLDNDADIQASMKTLIELLAHGSSCRKDPLIYVTGHPPDDQRSEGAGPDDATYTRQEQHRFVERLRAPAEAAAKAGLHVRFIDMFTPFLENRATTGFPKPTWTRGRAPDFAKIGRTNDRMHPRRLASIYCGEVVADGLDLGELRAQPVAK